LSHISPLFPSAQDPPATDFPAQEIADYRLKERPQPVSKFVIRICEQDSLRTKSFYTIVHVLSSVAKYLEAESPMRIYTISTTHDFVGLCWDYAVRGTEDDELDFVQQFWPGQEITEWIPPPLRALTIKEIAKREESKKIARERISRGTGNCPFYSAAVLFFDKIACDSLARFFLPNGQFLQTRVNDDGSSWFAFNCTRRIDAVDREKSDVEYYDPETPRLVRRYVLNEAELNGHDVFRLAWPETYEVFASQAVVDEINACGLQGIEATLIYSGS
jgi:hypothetical protein